MAIDVQRILIREVHFDHLLHKESPSWHTRRFFRWNTTNNKDSNSKYQKRQGRYLFGTMSTDSGCIHVEFMRYTKSMGDLLLTLSLPELFYGNNSHFLFFVNFENFAAHIVNELRFVLDISKLPSWKEWGISRDELTFDIPDIIETNRMRFGTLAKIKKLPYKNIDSTYMEKGSLYFHSGKKRKNAGVQLIIYFKDLQQAAKGNSLQQILELPPDHNVLRIEEKTKGTALRHRIDKTRTRNQIAKEFTNLEIALSPEHQTLHIMSIISSLGLDKKITTRDNLNQIIDNQSSLTPATKKTCKRVIRYLNGEFKTISLTSKTIEFYKKVILQTGFHFLYAERDVPPVTLDEKTGKCVVVSI